MIGVFVRRLSGAAMLDPATYEEIEADRGATIQALAVVVLASLAAGVGARGAAGTRPVLAHSSRSAPSSRSRSGRHLPR